jgi:deazaflavin-dependent oxidoreductase (nitroreductase family)
MDDRIRQALDQGQVIDITTTGRTSGEPRRIEIVFHNFDGRIYISGVPQPRERAWIRNLRADPALTVHLKGTVQADLSASARVVEEVSERERLMPLVAAAWNRTDIDQMVAMSPLIEITVPGYGVAAAA